MKKLLNSLLAFVIVLSLVAPAIVSAAGISANRTSITLTAGTTGSVTISASGCAGRVDYSSDNSSVAAASGKVWLDSTNGPKSASITISAKSVGTAHITVRSTDVATDAGADISGRTITITVNVVAPANYSSNNNFGSFGVKDHDPELTHDGDKYYLVVRESVEEIEIYATAEDPKAKVSGTGVKHLEYGENVFEVVVTAENGSKHVRTVTVYRKDGIYVEDIIPEINFGNDNFYVIKDDDHEVPGDAVKLINDEDKKIIVNEYDEDGNVISYVVINGSQLTGNDPIKLDVDYTPFDGIDDVTGYLKGICLNAEMGVIPDGVKIGVPVGDLCPDGTTVNIYRYNPETGELELVLADVLVNNGVIELEGIDASNLFITPGTYVPKVDVPEGESMHICFWFYIALASGALNVGQAVVGAKKKKENA